MVMIASFKAHLLKNRWKTTYICLEKKANPYPYIAHCDWYIQPSRYEGKSIAVTEAQILGKPVMVTAYPTAASQIAPGKDGLIVPMDTPESTAQAMGVALRDTDTRERMISYLQTHDLW